MSSQDCACAVPVQVTHNAASIPAVAEKNASILRMGPPPVEVREKRGRRNRVRLDVLADYFIQVASPPTVLRPPRFHPMSHPRRPLSVGRGGTTMKKLWILLVMALGTATPALAVAGQAAEG